MIMMTITISFLTSFDIELYTTYIALHKSFQILKTKIIHLLSNL